MSMSKSGGQTHDRPFSGSACAGEGAELPINGSCRASSGSCEEKNAHTNGFAPEIDANWLCKLAKFPSFVQPGKCHAREHCKADKPGNPILCGIHDGIVEHIFAGGGKPDAALPEEHERNDRPKELGTSVMQKLHGNIALNVQSQ